MGQTNKTPPDKTAIRINKILANRYKEEEQELNLSAVSVHFDS